MNNIIKKAAAVILPAAGLIWLLCAFVWLGSSKEARVEKIPVPYKVSEKKCEFIEEGWNVWIKTGKEGYSKAAVSKSYLFGIKTGQKEMYSSGIIKKPEDAVLIKGSGKAKHPITVPKETYAHYEHKLEATAYDPSPESNGIDWAGITCLGWRTRHGIAAVDPRVIALRSLLYIEGYGFAWAGDTGGDIKGKRIDLCYNTTKEALRYGRKKNVKVYVLGKRPPSYYAAKKN